MDNTRAAMILGSFTLILFTLIVSSCEKETQQLRYERTQLQYEILKEKRKQYGN